MHSDAYNINLNHSNLNNCNFTVRPRHKNITDILKMYAVYCAILLESMSLTICFVGSTKLSCNAYTVCSAADQVTLLTVTHEA